MSGQLCKLLAVLLLFSLSCHLHAACPPLQNFLTSNSGVWGTVQDSSSSVVKINLRFSQQRINIHVLNMGGNASSVNPEVYAITLDPKVSYTDETVRFGDTSIVPCGFNSGRFSSSDIFTSCQKWTSKFTKNVPYQVTCDESNTELTFTKTSDPTFVMKLQRDAPMDTAFCYDFAKKDVWWTNTIGDANLSVKFSPVFTQTISTLNGNYSMYLETPNDKKCSNSRAYTTGQYEIFSNYSSIVTKQLTCIDQPDTSESCKLCNQNNLLNRVYGVLSTSSDCNSWKVYPLSETTSFTIANQPPTPLNSTLPKRDPEELIIIVSSVVGSLCLGVIVFALIVVGVFCLRKDKKYIAIQ